MFNCEQSSLHPKSYWLNYWHTSCILRFERFYIQYFIDTITRSVHGKNTSNNSPITQKMDDSASKFNSAQVTVLRYSSGRQMLSPNPDSPRFDFMLMISPYQYRLYHKFNMWEHKNLTDTTSDHLSQPLTGQHFTTKLVFRTWSPEL